MTTATGRPAPTPEFPLCSADRQRDYLGRADSTNRADVLERWIEQATPRSLAIGP